MIETLNEKIKKKRVEAYLSLVGTQFAIVSFLMFFSPLILGSGREASNQHLRILIGILAALISGMTYSLLFFIWYMPAVPAQLEEIFRKSWVQYIIVLLPFGITGFLYFGLLSPDKFPQLFALLLSFWISCIEFLLFFSVISQRTNQPGPNSDNNKKKLIIVGCILFFLVLFLPSRLSSFLDGLPLDKPIEFVIAVLIIPLLLILNRSFFSKRYVLIIISIILFLKLVIFFTIPESGLNVWVFENSQNLADGKSEKSYTSFINTDVTQIMRAPYENTRQFPFSLLTDQILDNINGKFPAIFLTFQGSGRLEKGEKIIFQTTGLKQGEVVITDNTNGQFFIYDLATLNQGVAPRKIPFITDFKISGTFVFNNAIKYRLIPILQRPDGTQTDLFQFDRVWTTDNYGYLQPQQLLFVEWLVFFINLILVAVLTFGMALTLFNLQQQQRITVLDLFIFSSSSILLLIPIILGKDFKVGTPYKMLSLEVIVLTLPILAVLAIAGIIVLFEYKSRHTNFENPQLKYLFSIGIMILMLFLVLNVNTLRETTVVTVDDDPLEYQNFAKNIFVNGDWFLLNTPPRAYKVLFPYVVGSIHVIFGNSANAQFYLNAWCCVLSGLVLIKLLTNSGCRPVLAYCSSWIFTIILYGTFSFRYFQFGLIEPLATLFMMSMFLFAQKRQLGLLIISAIITSLLRMDYAGPIIAAILFYYEPLTGSVGTAWKETYKFVTNHWKQICLYIMTIFLPVLIIMMTYYFLTPGYWLNAGDTKHDSLYSIINGLKKIAAGGNWSEIYFNFTWFPLITILTTSTLLFGTFIGLFATVFRPKILQNLDLKWSIVLVGFYSVYFFVRPTGYSPRFSTPLLPISIIILTITAEQAIRSLASKKLIINQTKIGGKTII